MDNFSLIYKILKVLEKSMDLDEVNLDHISPEHLRVSQNRWCAIMEMLSDSGYIKGVTISRSVAGEAVVNICNLRITLKGLEYLAENSLMKKAEDAAKGIIDVIT